MSKIDDALSKAAAEGARSLVPSYGADMSVSSTSSSRVLAPIQSKKGDIAKTHHPSAYPEPCDYRQLPQAANQIVERNRWWQPDNYGDFSASGRGWKLYGIKPGDGIFFR